MKISDLVNNPNALAEERAREAARRTAERKLAEEELLAAMLFAAKRFAEMVLDVDVDDNCEITFTPRLVPDAPYFVVSPDRVGYVITCPLKPAGHEYHNMTIQAQNGFIDALVPELRSALSPLNFEIRRLDFPPKAFRLTIFSPGIV